MDFKELIKTLIIWALPAGVLDIARNIRKIHPRKNSLCRPNKRFNGIHKGKRCFILCNGPSIGRQDILLLKNDIVFSVSNGYHHKDYLAVQPRYHCLPRICYTKLFGPEKAIEWFKEMHSKIGTAGLFLDVAEAELVRKNKLFIGRNISYIYSGFCKNINNKKIINISRMVPEIGTVPISSIIIAMYMGFKEIYLLGADYDYWKTGEYKYFFEPTVLKGTDEFVFLNGKLRAPSYERFSIFSSVSKQFWILHNIARANGVSIFNATDGGALEEFPRVKFESLFLKQK